MDTNEQNRLLNTIIEQQKMHIQTQDDRIREQEATITELRKLVDELRSLKANMEETLNEFRRQFFGISSEKTDKQEDDPEDSKTETGSRSIP